MEMVGDWLHIGSSPHMRGTQFRSCFAKGFVRFIPAHAGNTTTPTAGTQSPTVHPRVCGEHTRVVACASSLIGSSPRMRGTRKIWSNSYSGCRFIPAYAGNTRAPSGKSRPSTVHPRVCGEHEITRGRSAAVNGSSPRMRGTRV